MANTLYDKGRQKFLDGDIDWSAHDIKVHLVRGYTPNAGAAGHEFLDDVTGGGGGTIVASSSNLSGKTSTSGIADADDLTFTSVAAGAACAHLVIARDTGSSATSPLIAVIDSATGLPVTPNGGNIGVTWDNATNKIFKL